MEVIEKTDITFVLYEGKHDAAILSRLLRENHYSNYTDKKLNVFPPNLKGYFDSVLRKFTYEDEGNLLQKPQLPNYICKSKNENKWFVFYEMSGDSRVVFTNELITNFKSIDSDFADDEQFETQQAVSLAFFFDADSDVNKRRERFSKDYSNILPVFAERVNVSKLSIIKSGEELDGFSDIGLFIYGRPDGTGTLEDILIPLMRKDNEEVFDDADSFLNKHMTEKDINSGSKKGKALIGVVGQVKKPGRPNQAIIADSKLIKKSKFESSEIFKEILAFLKSF